MKYTLIINQKALQEIAPELDAIDAIILDYLIHFCSADDAKIAKMTMEAGGKSERYTWISYAQLLRELPILKIKTKGAISRRVSKIEDMGFIKTAREPGKPRTGRLFVKLTTKIKELFFERVDLKQPKGLPQNNAGLPQGNVTYNNKHSNSKSMYMLPSLAPLAKNEHSSEKPKTEKQPVQQVIDFFYEACDNIKGFKPQITGSVEGPMILRYLKQYSVEDLKDELDWFLKSEKSDELGCTIKIALSAYVFNKWLAQRYL